MTNEPELCPRYERCNANVCPLELNTQRVQLKGEPVCFWLTEWVKAGGEARVTDELRKRINDPAVVERFQTALRMTHAGIAGQWYGMGRGWGEIRRFLESAAVSGSRLEAGRRLSASRAGPAGSAPSAPPENQS